MIRIAIDTSSGVATVVLSRDSELLSAVSTRGSVLALLHENIDSALHGARLTIGQIDEVCVVTGPGSWTGLHVAVTSAKTMSQILDVPLVQLSMLDALAYSLPATTTPIVALMDAKRDNVYSARYEWDREVLHTLMPPDRRGIEETLESAEGHGNALLLAGARPIQQTASKYLSRALAVETNVTYPSPEALIALGQDRSESRVDGIDRFDVVPDYMGEDFTIMPSSKVTR